MVQQPIEMGQLLNKNSKYSFTVWVYSEDHNPPHLHFIDKITNKLVLKLEITDYIPTNVDELKPMKSYSLTNTLAKEIIEWANDKNSFGLHYWYAGILLWNQLHPED